MFGLLSESRQESESSLGLIDGRKKRWDRLVVGIGLAWHA